MITDLTYPIHSGMFKYPSDPEVEVRVKRAEVIEAVPDVVDNAIRSSYGHRGGWEGLVTRKYKSGNVALSITNHHGTHVDAPAHKIPGGKTIDQYPIDFFVNKAMLIDLSDLKITQRQQRGITLEDIRGRIDGNLIADEDVTALLFYTGFCDRMAEMEGRLSGEQKKEFERGFTYFTQEAAESIAAGYGGLRIAGIDSFAFDPSGSNSEAHRAFFEKDVLLVETLVNLGMLKKADVFMLYCIPLLIKDGDAGQVRAYAETGIRQGVVEP